MENGDVNLQPIDRYADMLHRNGLKGVFVNGSSGEGYMLTLNERKMLAERWVQAAPADFKVLVHVGSCCLRDSEELARHAASVGAWGVGAMAPPFPHIGRVEELADYCAAIAAAAPTLPFYFYHIPAFNGCQVSMVELLRAMDGRVPNFAGIKYTFESLYEYRQCSLYANGKYDLLHGQDETMLASLAQGGAQGCICGTTNYNAPALLAVREAWQQGNLEEARRQQDYAQEVINVICRFRGNIVGGKRIMRLMGLDLGPNRTPFRNVTAEEEQKLREELNAINFFQHCNVQ